MDKIDVLNREKIVEQIFTLINNMTDNEISTSFAINGSWGCGKTFVLDLLQEKLESYQSESSSDNKYFVIRYNCWKYDYYEEPLIAIVSSLLSIIDKKTKIFPNSKRLKEAEGMLKAAGEALLTIGNATIKNATGVDIGKACELIKTGKHSGDEEYKADNQYDIYFCFKQVMERLSDALDKIANEYSIIFLVDELDRCLPEYAVKVLERLHHLTGESSKIITIISIDKKQLMTSINQIFGFENTEKYLEKFIHFEIKLNIGSVSDRVTEKYKEYLSLFDKELFPFSDSIEEYFSAVFRDIDIRAQEQLMKKILIVHSLLYSDKKDYSFMCMEVLISILFTAYGADSNSIKTEYVKLGSWKKVFYVAGHEPAFSSFFQDKFEKIPFGQQQDPIHNITYYVLQERIGLYEAILMMWCWVHEKQGNILVQMPPGIIYDLINNNISELKKFIETFQMIN